MQENLYFGALEVRVNCPRPVNWHPFETVFFTPALPVKRTVSVEVSFVKELPDPQGTLIYSTESMQIFSGKGERYYKPVYASDQRISTYSVQEKNRVYVQQLADSDLWYNRNFYLLASIHIEHFLLGTGGLILHSCYTEYRGRAILFTAPSGTGKTTQAEIWKRVYGSTIVNGDKCILQKTDNGFMACGFFLHGSAAECENRSMPVSAVVIVRQSQTDYVEELSPAQKLGLLYSEITVNHWDAGSVFQTMDLLEEIIRETTVLMLHCTMKDSSAHVLHEYLFGE